jgi:phage terminase large subunit
MADWVVPGCFKDFCKPARYKVAYGGRGSGKSRSFAMLAIDLVERNKAQMLILCAREIQNSIGDSVHALISELVSNRPGWEITKTEIRYKNGSRFIFKGLYRNVHSIKSTEGIDIAWVEEAQAVSRESLELLIPTVRKPGSEIWFTFNPDQETDPVYDMFITNKRDDAVVKQINHTDNPFFPDVLRSEMEYDREHDTDKYLHVWEGKCRTFTDAQVFHGKYRVSNFDPSPGATFYYGADWGFSQDPTTLVRCFIDDGCLYIDQEAYGVGVDIDATPNLFKTVPDADKWIVTADSARPETISFMQRHGFPKLRRALKGKNSIEDGISFLRSFREIVIHERCKHTIDEFKLYSYKRDKLTGDILPIIEDKHNHMIDALRYATEGLRRAAPQISATIKR